MSGCTGRDRKASLGLVLGGVLLLVWTPLAAQPQSSPPGALLVDTLSFRAEDVRALDAGAAVIRRLDTPVREELGYVGAVFVDAPAEEFIERYRDIERFEAGPGIPVIGRFSDPPRMEDLTALRLPAEDLESLRKCRPGNCDVKLPAASMRRFREEVDWKSPDAGEEASALARELILDLVVDYQANGNRALGDYDDGDDPLSVAEQFRGILSSRDPMPATVPELLEHLDTYPRSDLARAEDFFYWTMVDFGLKRTIRVNHVTIYPLDANGSSDVVYVIAIKQLYASHYFYTTLELRFLVDDHRREGRRGTCLISITRSRNDGMTGFKGLFVRPIVRRRSIAAVRGYLNKVKTQVELPLPVATPSR